MRLRHLHQYAQDGPRSVDLLTLGWAPGRVLTDRAKFAAIAVYLPIQARSSVWEYENSKICLYEYYIKQEGLTREQGASIIKATPKPIFPISWDEANALEQETADLMAAGRVVEKFDATTLFDGRFDRLAAQLIPETYWT